LGLSGVAKTTLAEEISIEITRIMVDRVFFSMRCESEGSQRPFTLKTSEKLDWIG
jgi:hypothetical protein